MAGIKPDIHAPDTLSDEDLLRVIAGYKHRLEQAELARAALDVIYQGLKIEFATRLKARREAVSYLRARSLTDGTV
jgi:hypothetical protein